MERSAGQSNGSETVLVTGATGYLAINCVQLLLNDGYNVRGTVRDLNNKHKIDPLLNMNNSQNLQLLRADLTDEHAWCDAIKGCDYVLHIASPCDTITDCSVVDIAVSGTLNVLNAIYKYHNDSVKKIVVTSSCSTVNQGHKNFEKVFSEKDWAKVDEKLHNYHRSKILAEQAAWDFMKDHPDAKFKMTVLNPSLLVGPLLQNNKGASAKLISRFMDGTMKAIPSLALSYVDVHDAALAHVRALHITKCDNERILITARTLSACNVASILHNEFHKQGYAVPRRKAPFLLVRLFSLVDKETKQMVKLGKDYAEHFDNSKAKTLLGMQFNDPEKAIIDMCYDMIERGILPKKSKYKPKSQCS